MDRRTFNKMTGLATLGILEEKGCGYGQAPSVPMATAAGAEIVIDDHDYLVAFDKATGALTRLLRKSTGWTITGRAELAVSFRILLPLPHHRANFILGQKQRAVRVDKLSDREVQLEWSNLVSEHGSAPHRIRLQATVTIENGAVIFTAILVNESGLMVETVDFPYFGDVKPPGPAEALRAENMWYGNLESTEIYPHFQNEKGYWGVLYPTKTIPSKRSSFCLLQAASQGLYVEMRDPAVTYLLEFTFEQHPAVTESVANSVPRADKVSGMPVHLEFRTCHFVFVHPDSTADLKPVVLRAYDGDWHAGVDVYKHRRSTWFQQPRIAAWAKDVHSWLQLQIDGAEQDFSIPYRELPKYIDECAENGVAAIQLVGWNIGGQDGGDPCLDTDPGLGTWEELHQAILYARGKGVKIILFGKPIWADLTTDWYQKDLYKYGATDPYGIPYQTNGYSYSTPTQLAGINNRRRAIMDVQCQVYRDIATKEFEKTVKLGAAGWLFDEVCHHGPVDYSFNPNHGYLPPGYVYGGDMPMARQFRETADKVDPDFLFAGEGPQDWLMQYYPLSYFRINSGSRPACRYIDSQAPLMVAVTGIDDREMLNLILLNRYIISYEPFNFKGHVTDFPMTLAYGKKIDALRRRYREWIWDAEFLDTVGARVEADGAHRYSAFSARTGKRAVVIVNQEMEKTISARLNLPNPGRLVAATPENPEAQPTPGTVVIPKRSAAVVMEQ